MDNTIKFKLTFNKILRINPCASANPVPLDRLYPFGAASLPDPLYPKPVTPDPLYPLTPKKRG
jgi:hypothetical protein